MILKTGWSEDPQQKMIQRLMLYGVPFSLLFSGLVFPIGVVIYWVVQNLFSLGQQMWVLRKYPPPKTGTSGKPAAAKAGGPKPGGPKPGGGKDDKNGAARPVDGKALSSGVDQFTLVREPAGWRIAAIAYTSIPVK